MAASHTHRLRGDVTDVDQALPADGALMRYSAARGLWTPKTLALADLPAIAFDDLSNVTLPAPAVADSIAWSGTAWVNVPWTRTICTSATRSAAVPAPVAGQQVYLTDFHLEQTYDGSAWVTTTPGSDLIATNEATTVATYGNLATVGPTVTLETGTRALLRFGALMYQSAGSTGYMAIEVFGATTVAAADIRSISEGSTATGIYMARDYLWTGLTPGTNTFRAKYRSTGGIALNTADRWLTVQGLP